MSTRTYSRLFVLPKLFYLPQDDINSELFEELWRTNGHKPRELKNLLGAPKDTTKPADRFLELAQQAQDPHFRQKWYEDAYFRRKNHVVPLYHQVHRYVLKRSDDFEFDSPSLQPFFLRRDGKSYPKLDQIDLFVDFLESHLSLPNNAAALFAWSLLESTQYHSFHQPRETSLTGFRFALEEALRRRDANHFLELLRPGPWMPADTLKIENGNVLSNLESLTRGEALSVAIDEVMGHESESDADVPNELVLQAKNLISEIDELFVTKYLTSVATLTILSDGLKQSENPSSDLQLVASKVREIENTANVINEKSKLLLRTVENALEEAVGNWHVDMVGLLKATVFNGYDFWRKEASDCIKFIQDASKIVRKLGNYPDALVQKLIQDQHGLTISTRQAFYSALERIHLKAEEQHNLTSSYQAILENVAGNAIEITWNAIHEDTLLENDWQILAKVSLEQSPWEVFSLLSVRKTFSYTSSLFAKKCIDLLSEKHSGCTSMLVKAVSHLSLPQLEKLAHESPKLELFVALAELQSFYLSEGIQYFDSLAYWSHWPLNQYTKQEEGKGSSLREKFFGAIFHAAVRDNPLRSIVGLRNIVEEVKRDLKAVGESSYNQDVRYLRDLLQYHPHGAGNYAALWKIAYHDLIDPLNRYLDEDYAFIDAVGKIVEVLKDVSIDERYQAWIKDVPGQFQNQSHYEKATKVYVGARINEIIEWCATVQDELNTHSVPDASLVEALAAIESSDSSDAEYIRAWLSSLSQISDTRRTAPLVTFEESESDLWATPSGIEPEPDQPRAFLAFLSGQNVEWGHLITDELGRRAGNLTTDDLLRMYRAATNLEALERLCESDPNSISAEELNGIKRESDLLAIKCAINFADLRTRIESAGSSYDANHLLSELGGYLAKRHWTKFQAHLILLEAAAEDAERSAVNQKKREHLINEIKALGGRCHGDEALTDLESLYDELFKKTTNRRKHIAPLSRFIETSNLIPELVAAARSALDHLSDSSRLPDEVSSEFLEETFALVLDNLSEQLRRSKTLLPDYRNLLEIIALWFLNSVKAENCGINIDSSFISHCLRIGPALRGASSLEELNHLFFAISENDPSVSSLVSARNAPAFEASPEDPEDIPSLVEEPWDAELLSEAGVLTLATVESRVISWLLSLKVREQSGSSADVTLLTAIKGKRWMKGLWIALNEINVLTEEQRSTGQWKELEAGAIICALYEFGAETSTEDYVHALSLLDHIFDIYTIKSLSQHKLPSSEMLLGELLANLILRFSSESQNFTDIRESEKKAIFGNAIRELITVRGAIGGSFTNTLRTVFALYEEDSLERKNSVLLRSLWDLFSGEKIQADIRGSLLVLLWKAGLYRSLAHCFTFHPIDMEERIANGYARILKLASAGVSPGAVENLRRASVARPFTFFTEHMFSEFSRNAGLPAEIRWAAPLEKLKDKQLWRGVIEVLPREINPPVDIEVEFSKVSGVTTQTGSSKLKLSGPFFERTERPIILRIDAPEVSHLTVALTCKFITLEGTAVNSSLVTEVESLGAEPFVGLSFEVLDEAFNSFPRRHMRGKEFIPRVDDESQIEKILFGGSDAGSLWISSPRRSGKTSMLFRILDAFSHAAGRDNAVLYFTFDKQFNSVREFNAWIWQNLRSGKDNEDFRARFDNFLRIGEDLPFDGGAHDFIFALYEKLKKHAKANWLNRLYFLFDEVDRLAQMHLTVGQQSETVTELMWQLRHVISSSAEVGFVFSGSSPARRYFVEDSNAAFYNGIPRMDLTPFSADSQQNREASKQIVLPDRLRGTYKLPDQTLKHLLWVTAGIPYYMKLVAGGMYSVAKQSYLVPSDVNAGLQAILAKSTGVAKLDSLDNPGEDELRTLFASSEEDRLLARAILYALAELRSPLERLPVRTGELRGAESPLINRYGFTREMIERGLQLSIELGYVRHPHTNPMEIEFIIPILGESIRSRRGVLWAGVHDRLEELARQWKN